MYNKQNAVDPVVRFQTAFTKLIAGDMIWHSGTWSSTNGPLILNVGHEPLSEKALEEILNNTSLGYFKAVSDFSSYSNSRRLY